MFGSKFPSVACDAKGQGIEMGGDVIAGPIVFLDIDDVLNSARLAAACRDFDVEIAPPARIPLRGDTVAVDLLNRICERCDARIVVSSSWVRVLGWAYTREWLLRSGLDAQHLHEEACVFYGLRGSKRHAIRDWLEDQPEIPLSRICVVDDDTSLFEREDPMRRRQVVVDGPDGLRLKHFKAIISKIGRVQRKN